MEHIRQYDWCSSEPDIHFLSEQDLDNSVTERILRNKFHDPLLSSESEDENTPKVTLNWDEIFNRKNKDKTFRMVVQGIHPHPPFTKLSALTGQQHYHCLRVLCGQNPDVLPGMFIGRPSKLDQRVFEEVKEVYAKEQQEFKDWAKSLWTSSHCVRALRPKPPIEMVYEAYFKVATSAMLSFPKKFSMAAQIPLEDINAVCEMVYQKELVKVNISSLPQIEYPDMSKRISIMRHCPVPEPCTKHPCRFILPTDTSMTIMPLTEIHRELAQYAADHSGHAGHAGHSGQGPAHVASENALRCLTQQDRHWSLALSVCPVITSDGDTRNVVVLGTEFSIHRETAPMRTYKAFRKLLEFTLIPQQQMKLLNKKQDTESNRRRNSINESESKMDVSDEDEDNLYIDTDCSPARRGSESDRSEEPDPPVGVQTRSRRRSDPPADNSTDSDMIDFYSCTCKDTVFERPTPRSYRRWRVRNKTTHDTHDLIVHCPHRVRGRTGEVIVEPIPEYQLDLGASEQPPDRIRALALALLLRRNASVLNVRIDSASGDIVTTEALCAEEFNSKHGDVTVEVVNRIHAALSQLAALVPGHYVLHHEPGHGSNALLYSSRTSGPQTLRLEFDCAQLTEADEAKGLKTPPNIVPVLLPIHKYRKILPCAFTPYQNQLAKEPKKPVSRQKTPPQAIKWPKKKQKKKKKQ